MKKAPVGHATITKRLIHVATTQSYNPSESYSHSVNGNWVHVAMANLKRFILGTFHGTSRVYIQEYLNEFCYRFNRRFWEDQIPMRLLTLCANHTKVS